MFCYFIFLICASNSTKLQILLFYADIKEGVLHIQHTIKQFARLKPLAMCWIFQKSFATCKSQIRSD